MELLFIIGGAIIAIIVLLSVFYVKAPPSTAYIISGLTKEPRYLIGKGGFRVPGLERVDHLALSQITIDINTKEYIPTKDFIDVNIDAVAIIQVSKENIQLAAKNYINVGPDKIGASISQTLSGCLREAIGTVEFKELNLNRDAFSKTVTKNAQMDISALGLEIASCNIERISDKNGLVESLGADNTWRIRKDAALTKAQNEQTIREAEAKANADARAKEVEALEAIAERENNLEIKRANLKKASEVVRAQADAAYKIEELEQSKTLNDREVESQIVRTKREQDLTAERLKVRENELTAEINKKSDAEKYRVEIEAAAKYEKECREAEAQLVIAAKKAEAVKLQAEAERIKKEQEALGLKALAEAEAAKIKLEGEAQAKAIQAKGEAEAVALKKKADAFNQYGQAAILDMVVKILPEMAANVAEPISAISDVHIYGNDGSGVSAVSGNVPAVLKQTLDTLESVGIPVTGMLEAKTKEAMTDRNIGISGNGVISKNVLNS